VAIEASLKATDSWMSSPGDIKGADVAILGFEGTGIALAKYLTRKGAKIVAICDPDCTVHNPQGIDIEVRPLEVRSAEEVFDLEGRMRAEAREFSIEAFVDSIQETLAEKDGEDLPDIIRGLPGTPEPVKEAAILYWEQAR